MGLLPPDFQFSQRNLQDYVDCRRRFQLRHLQHLAWPAVEAEPLREHEHRMQAGQDFHRLVQRHLLGVPPERLSAMLEAGGSRNEDLQRWWQNYLAYAGDLIGPGPSAGNMLVETTLSAPFSAYRLIAKFDLIRWGEDHSNSNVVIVDWKTSMRRPPREWLAERLQTRVYPYLLIQAGESIFGGGALDPEQIEMVYWFAEHPGEPHLFPYSDEQYQLDHDYLNGLVAEIEALAEEDFHLTPDESRCKFCTYRSLCDRGLAAGALDKADDDLEAGDELELTLDFDQIAEIEF